MSLQETACAQKCLILTRPILHPQPPSTPSPGEPFNPPIYSSLTYSLKAFVALLLFRRLAIFFVKTGLECRVL